LPIGTFLKNRKSTITLVPASTATHHHHHHLPPATRYPPPAIRRLSATAGRSLRASGGG
jgi:hypothetical protein